MLAKVLTDRYYGSPAKLAMAIGAVLRRQLAGIDAAVVQLDEATSAGTPRTANGRSKR